MTMTDMIVPHVPQLAGVPVPSLLGIKQLMEDSFHWTAPKIVLSLFLFILAGLAEIGGGWLVWQAVRGRCKLEGKPWWQNRKAVMCVTIGSLSLVGYGFIPTAQPPPTFGRLYAVYGGFFVLLSFVWGWIVDKDRPDKGDCIGGALAIAGVALALFYPR